MEQKGKGEREIGLREKEVTDILYKIKLDAAAVAMGISILGFSTCSPYFF